MTYQQPSTEHIVPLIQPRWVTGLRIALLCIASLAIFFSAAALGATFWLACLLSTIPVLVHAIGSRHQKKMAGRVLVISVDNLWQLAFFSEINGLTDRIEVIVNKRWQHIFGLSLGLKLQKCPHNQSKTLMMVVWRQCLSSAVFREVALQSARQVEVAEFRSKGDAA